MTPSPRRLLLKQGLQQPLFQELEPPPAVGERPDNVFLHHINGNTQLFCNGAVTFVPKLVQKKNLPAARRQLGNSLLQSRQSLLSIDSDFRCPSISQTVCQVVTIANLATIVATHSKMIEDQIVGHLKQKRTWTAELIALRKTENSYECVMHQISGIATRQLFGDELAQHITVFLVEDGNINFIVVG
jgi:hypothetical protein